MGPSGRSGSRLRCGGKHRRSSAAKGAVWVRSLRLVEGLELPEKLRAYGKARHAPRRANRSRCGRQRAVYACIRRQARKQGIRLSHCGSVTFVQRFGSDLRPNVHFHALVLDGVYAEAEDGELVFHPTPAPDEDDSTRIARRVRRRVGRVLKERGFTMEGVDEEEGDQEDETPLRLGAASASAAGTIAQGPRSGKHIPPIERVAWGGAGASRRDTSAGGFNVHVGVALEADDRPGLEPDIDEIGGVEDRLQLGHIVLLREEVVTDLVGVGGVEKELVFCLQAGAIKFDILLLVCLPEVLHRVLDDGEGLRLGRRLAGTGLLSRVEDTTGEKSGDGWGENRAHHWAQDVGAHEQQELLQGDSRSSRAGLSPESSRFR
ncbi:MAG: hypothetical protein CME06_12120 [Gemmatimonadetes bacterium]|nr:hypothetical protein [Gemmatimonadota bacterium]